MNQHQYQIGQEVVPGYTLVRPLGSGMAGDVWVARGAGGMSVALKIVRSLSAIGGRKELKALETIRDIRHPNICPVHGFWTKDAEQLIVVMGLGDCTLHDRLLEVRQQAGLTIDDNSVNCGLGAEETIHFLRPAADAIDELNQQHNIYHCDIKPQNILFVGGGAQVCDFGLANRIEGDSRMTRHPFATPAYAAPEVLDGMTYSRGVDQYSLAVTYYELRTGQLPFDSSSAAKMLQAKCSGKLDLTCVSSAERKVLQKAMHVDPDRRYRTCTQFINDLAVASGVDRRSRMTPLRLCAMGLALIVVAGMAALAFQRFTRQPGPKEVAGRADEFGREPAELPKAAADSDDGRPLENLQQATATVHVQVDIPGAVVHWADNKLPIDGTSTEFPMPLGTHSIRVEKPGYEAFTAPAFAVSADSENTLDIDLVPLDYPIVIQTDPPDSQLTWNGTTLQRDHDNTIRLPVGSHQIHAEREGFKSESKTIVVADENNDQVLFKLARVKMSVPTDRPEELDRNDQIQRDAPAVLKKDEARFTWLFARYGVRGPATAEISERQLTQAIELDPGLGRAYRDRGIARTTLGMNAAARQDFEAAIKLMGENFHLRQEYAKLLARMSVASDPTNRDELVENCKQQCAAALEIRPHATGPRLLRAEFLFRQNKNAEAKNEAERLKEDSIDPEQRSYAWNLLGLISRREGNQSDAFANLKSAIAADPKNAEAHLNLGMASRDAGRGKKSAERTELLEQALNHYTMAIQIKAQLRQQVLPLIAEVQEDLGMFEAAIGTYTRLIEVFGPTAERYRKRAGLYDQIGNADEAAKNLARALDLEQGKQ